MSSIPDRLADPSTFPQVVVVSGPSGAGKDAILNQLKQGSTRLYFVVTLTTRSQRANERDMVDYHFVSEPEFQELLNRNGLLEWANVYGHWYGVPKQPVKDALAQGQDTIIKVDIQGAFTLKKILPEAIQIFIAPPTLSELADRLHKRHTESEFDIALRLKMAEMEMQGIDQFDYVVINYGNQLNQAVAQIKAILTAEKCRTHPRRINL